jgi:hypothetical protein
VASIIVAPVAQRNLDRIITTCSIPSDTRERVRNRIEPFSDLPLLGSQLKGEWVGRPGRHPEAEWQEQPLVMWRSGASARRASRQSARNLGHCR